jgi:hypothetical protein
MRKTYTYPFYLIINEADQPLFSFGGYDQIWLFYTERDAYNFLRYKATCERNPNKKRYVVKVSINSLEEIREYITSIK